MCQASVAQAERQGAVVLPHDVSRRESEMRLCLLPSGVQAESARRVNLRALPPRAATTLAHGTGQVGAVQRRTGRPRPRGATYSATAEAPSRAGTTAAAGTMVPSLIAVLEAPPAAPWQHVVQMVDKLPHEGGVRPGTAPHLAGSGARRQASGADSAEGAGAGAGSAVVSFSAGRSSGWTAVPSSSWSPRRDLRLLRLRLLAKGLTVATPCQASCRPIPRRALRRPVPRRALCRSRPSPSAAPSLYLAERRAVAVLEAAGLQRFLLAHLLHVFRLCRARQAPDCSEMHKIFFRLETVICARANKTM